MKGRKWAGVLLLAAIIAVVLLPMKLVTAQSTGTTVTFDVAADGRTFVLNRENKTAASIQRGDTFVVNGTIYPGGTIPAGGTKSAPSSFGPDSPGSVGEWFCRGSFLVSSGQMSTEKIQRASTHYFALTDKNRLITEGFEGSANITRAVIGGINQFAGARGLVSMERLGVNPTGSYNLRFTFTLE